MSNQLRSIARECYSKDGKPSEARKLALAELKKKKQGRAMEELTWLEPVRRFTREHKSPTDVEPITQQIELRQRSDGVLFYLMSEPVNDRTRKLSGGALAEYRAARKRNQDTQWEVFLTMVGDAFDVEPRPLGWLKENHGLTSDWSEVEG